MRAPDGQRLCRACRRAESPGDAQDVLRELSDSQRPAPTQPGAKSGITGRGLGCIVIACVASLAVLLAVVERPSGPSQSGAGQVVAQASAGRADDAEADDAVRMLRAYYELGQAVAVADDRWAKCHDETVGFDALLACAKGVHEEVARLRAKLPPVRAASGACGHEVEGAHRAYIEGQERFHADVVAWLEKYRTALARPLSRAALPDGACDAAPKACEAQPIVYAETYGAGDGASYARVNGIECTKRLFRCGPADNVCFVNKVASRLGLGPEAKRSGDLSVRSTWRRVE